MKRETYTSFFTLLSAIQIPSQCIKVVVPDNVRRDLCAQRIEGEKLLNNFVTERIQKGTVSVWSKMKKRKLLTWKLTGKKSMVTANNKIVELQEDRSLFARMVMVCRTRPDIDVQEAVGVHKFTVVPRPLFAADGSMLNCSNKSALMTLIENEDQASLSRDEQMARKVDIIDMAWQTFNHSTSHPLYQLGLILLNTLWTECFRSIATVMNYTWCSTVMTYRYS